MPPSVLLAALLTILLVALAVRAYRRQVRLVVVHEFEAGLRYKRGLFVGPVGPGVYRLFRTGDEVITVDGRRQALIVPGQEVLSADHVTLKISLALTYSITDAASAMHTVASYFDTLHIGAQLALRAAVAGAPVADLLARRDEIARQVTAQLAPAATTVGITLHEVALRDVMFPGDLKRVFAAVVTAQQEALANLERARGETAALRSLANAARQFEANPALLTLRWLQAVETAGRQSRNGIVVNVPPGVFTPPAS